MPGMDEITVVLTLSRAMVLLKCVSKQGMLALHQPPLFYITGRYFTCARGAD